MDSDYGFYLQHFTPWEAACYCIGIDPDMPEDIEATITELLESNDPDNHSAAQELDEQRIIADEIYLALTREISSHFYSDSPTSLKISLEGTIASIFPDDASGPDFTRTFISKESLVYWYKAIHDENAINIKEAPDQLKQLNLLLDGEHDYAPDELVLCINTWLRMLTVYEKEFKPIGKRISSMHDFSDKCLREVLGIEHLEAPDKIIELQKLDLRGKDGKKKTIKATRINIVTSWDKTKI